MNQKEKPDWRALSPVVRLALGAAVLLVAALAVYWPGLNGGYILDDDLWVNASRKTFAGLMEIWRASKTPDFFPLTSTTFWLEWPLWGLDPLGYHLVNVLIHWASAVVLWRVLRRLAIPGAWLGAMLFVVHPVNVESVIWISQRKNTLSMFFFLSTLWGYVRSEEKSGEDPEKLEPPSSFYYGLSLFFFVLALLSKTAVVMLPVVLLGCAWWLRGRIVLRDWLRSLPFFGLAATLGVVTICLQTSRAIGADVVNTADFWGRLTGAGRAVWFYFEKAVWPMNLAFVYPRWELNGHLAAAYLPLAAMVLVAGILWWYRRTTMGRSLCFALGYFVVMLLPVLGFVDIYYFRYSRVADHWQYYSLIGIIALAAGWLGASFKFQLSHFKLWLTVIIVAGLSVSAWRQVRLYRSPDVLWENLLVKDPACWLAHNLLGHRAGFTPGAAAHFRASLRLKPDQMEALLNLGAIELRLNLDDEAMADYAQAKKIAPNVPMVEVGLGLVYEKCTNLLAAEAAFRRATKLEPDNALYHRLLGSALQAEGLLFQSLVELREAARLDPSMAAAHHNLGVVFAQLGRKQEAEAEFREAIRLDPTGVEAHNGLGKILAEAGKMAAAEKEFAESIRLQPVNGGSQYNLANTMFVQGRREDALPHFLLALADKSQPILGEANYQTGVILYGRNEIEAARDHWREAVKFKPDWIDALNNLAWLLSTQPEAKYRDGAEAVRLAEHAVALTQTNNAGLLDTLAATYAEAGRFSEATATASRALQLKPAASGMAAQIQSRLDLYRSGKPFRELPGNH